MQEQQPYYFMGIPCHNKQVVQEFCTIFIAMILVPLGIFYGLWKILENTTVAGLISVMSIQVIIGIYIYLIVTNKENFSASRKKVKAT